MATPAVPCHDSDVGPARFIGREDSVADLCDALMSARETDHAHCVLVTGEAGIGKSRLVAEALAAGVADLPTEGRALLVTAHGAHMSTGEIPFGVLADTMRDLVHRAGADVLTDTERASLAPLLPGTVPSMELQRVQVLSAFLDLLQRLATEQPVVWVVEDLHWADGATRDLINLAVRTLRGRLLVVATVRTDDPDRSIDDDARLTSYVTGLARLPHTTVIPLARFTPDQVRLQLRELLGPDLSPGVAARIQELSDGVPFVVEELAAAQGRPGLTAASGAAAGRLVGLSADARRLVEAAAVGEGHLRIGLLERVIDALPEELDLALAETVRAGILTTDHEADAVSFRHALVRDAADRELGPGARRAWHRRWAEVLHAHPGVLAADPVTLAIAEHARLAGDVRQALASAAAALPAAQRIGDPTAETRLWIRILSVWESVDAPEDLAGTDLRTAVAHAYLASRSGSMGDKQALLDAVPAHLLTEVERSVLALHRLIAAEAKGEKDWSWQPDVVRLFDGLALDELPRDMFSVLALFLATRLPPSDPRGPVALELAADIAHEIGSPRARMQEISLRSHAAHPDGDRRAEADFLERELRVLRADPDESLLLLEGNLAWCLTSCGEHRRAQEVGEAALSRLRHPQLSLQVWEHLLENHTFSLLCTGGWVRARELLDASSPWWEDDLRSSNLRLDTLELAQRGVADVRRWDVVLGAEIAGGAPALQVRHLLAAAAAAGGDLATAREGYAALLAEAHPWWVGDYLWLPLVHASRSEADAVALDPDRPDREAAARHLAALAEVAESTSRHGLLGETWPLDVAAQLDRFHGRDARPALRSVLAGWERIGHVPDVATTHLSLAEQEAVHGDRDVARQHLAAARGIATRLAAVPLLDRAALLADRWALRTRDRRAADLLTGREAEVLSLVAEGRTNAEIAATLFMSPKTASVHVSHIIAKLGAANRTEAAATARRQGLLQ